MIAIVGTDFFCGEVICDKIPCQNMITSDFGGIKSYVKHEWDDFEFVSKKEIVEKDPFSSLSIVIVFNEKIILTDSKAFIVSYRINHLENTFNYKIKFNLVNLYFGLESIKLDRKILDILKPMIVKQRFEQK